MEEEKLIPASEFCMHHNIEISFIRSLNEYGLIEIASSSQEDPFISLNQLRDLEKLIRLHYDLDINLEGLDVINHLLKRLEQAQDEILLLKNKLRFYESQE